MLIFRSPPTQDLKIIIRREFNLGLDAQFHLVKRLGSVGKDMVWAKIPPSQWLPVIREMVKNDPSTEILVVRH